MNAQPQETQFLPEGPQPLLRETAPGMAYPVQCLGPLRAAVEAVQGMTQAPVAIPAQSALAVASLAVMAFADVETLGGNRPPVAVCPDHRANGGTQVQLRRPVDGRPSRL